jgi:hypothetical protein
VADGRVHAREELVAAAQQLTSLPPVKPVLGRGRRAASGTAPASFQGQLHQQRQVVGHARPARAARHLHAHAAQAAV